MLVVRVAARVGKPWQEKSRGAVYIADVNADRALKGTESRTLPNHRRAQCLRQLSTRATAHLGYDGFSGPTSLFKTERADVVDVVNKALTTKGWEAYARTFRC